MNTPTSSEALPPTTGSSVWDPLDDEFEEILGGSWAVIRTADGWEIECQHSQTTLPLKSTDMESAKIEGRKLARKFERRHQTNVKEHTTPRNEA